MSSKTNELIPNPQTQLVPLNPTSYNEMAYQMMHYLNQYQAQADNASCMVHISSIYFAKHVFQYFVCTDDNGHYQPLNEHMYDDNGQMNIIYFLSLKELKHRTSSNKSKSLKNELKQLWEMYQSNDWTMRLKHSTIYQYWNSTKQLFHRYRNGRPLDQVSNVFSFWNYFEIDYNKKKLLNNNKLKEKRKSAKKWWLC